MIRRRDFLKWTGSATAAVCLGGLMQGKPTAAQQGSRPNVIFIFADDYGIGGVRCYGSHRFKTPSLDALAETGMRFEYCFSMPLCAPSRAVCMTGRYPFRTGVVDNDSGSRAHPDKELCIAKVLKQAGYATAVAGKWRQLSYFTTRQDAQRWGFDEFLIWGVDIGQGKGSRYWDPDFNMNGQPLSNAQGKYGPDVLYEFVVDFIRRHQDQPFFVYYPMVLIHGPILRTPDSAAAGADHYADNIAYLDKLVGKLVSELDRMNICEKTLIVFTGDNGCTLQASGTKGGSSGGTVNGRAIDGAKGSMKEGGSRVPLIVSWKGTTPSGQVSKDLVDFSDFFPTFAELADAKLPADVTIDGHSFAPQLKGGRGKPRQWIFVQLDQQWYVRDVRWKLNQAGELFDMKDAPFREILTQADSPEAQAALANLQAAIDALRPPNDRRTQDRKRTTESAASATGKRKKQN